MKQDKLTVKRDLLTSLAKGFYNFGAFFKMQTLKTKKMVVEKGLIIKLGSSPSKFLFEKPFIKASETLVLKRKSLNFKKI